MAKARLCRMPVIHRHSQKTGSGKLTGRTGLPMPDEGSRLELFSLNISARHGECCFSIGLLRNPDTITFNKDISFEKQKRPGSNTKLFVKM